MKQKTEKKIFKNLIAASAYLSVDLEVGVWDVGDCVDNCDVVDDVSTVMVADWLAVELLLTLEVVSLPPSEISISAQFTKFSCLPQPMQHPAGSQPQLFPIYNKQWV